LERINVPVSLLLRSLLLRRHTHTKKKKKKLAIE
jgi:hypothetical protein